MATNDVYLRQDAGDGVNGVRLRQNAPDASGITGALAATEAQDTAALLGALGHTGTLAATESQDAASFTGTHGETGTLAATESQDAASFTGTHGETGTLAATESQDAASFTGTHGETGTLAATESQDVAAFSGVVTSSGVTGILSATEIQDGATLSGALQHVGTVDAAETQDTAYFTSPAPVVAIWDTSQGRAKKYAAEFTPIFDAEVRASKYEAATGIRASKATAFGEARRKSYGADQGAIAVSVCGESVANTKPHELRSGSSPKPLFASAFATSAAKTVVAGVRRAIPSCDATARGSPSDVFAFSRTVKPRGVQNPSDEQLIVLAHLLTSKRVDGTKAKLQKGF